MFSLQNPFTDAAVVDSIPVIIGNPSTLLTPYINPFLFIPTGENANNFYINCIVQRIDNSLAVVNTSNIIAYDGLTRLAQLDTAFTGFNANDSIIIRRKAASETGTTQSGTSTTTFVLATTASSEPNFYVGSFIRFPGSLSPISIPTTTTNGNETRKIVRCAFGSLTGRPFVASPIPLTTASLKPNIIIKRPIASNCSGQ